MVCFAFAANDVVKAFCLVQCAVGTLRLGQVAFDLLGVAKIARNWTALAAGPESYVGRKVHYLFYSALVPFV
jgi:hypothetical protein